MIKFCLFGYEIIVSKANELQRKASDTKKKIVLEKIRNALNTIEEKDLKYSEYLLQKESGVSINTIKKYRSEIKKMRGII